MPKRHHKCKCGNYITGYDRYLLGNDTDICVECRDEQLPIRDLRELGELKGEGE